MKASELIARLQKEISSHGDLEVVTDEDLGLEPLESVILIDNKKEAEANGRVMQGPHFLLF